jgi:hypothetical protein
VNSITYRSYLSIRNGKAFSTFQNEGNEINSPIFTLENPKKEKTIYTTHDIYVSAASLLAETNGGRRPRNRKEKKRVGLTAPHRGYL